MRTWIALLMFVFAQALAHAQGPVSAAVIRLVLVPVAMAGSAMIERPPAERLPART